MRPVCQERPPFTPYSVATWRPGGTGVRVLPAGNDVARLAPLKAGRAQASAMGIGVYFAQEDVFELATKEWGPQPL